MTTGNDVIAFLTESNKIEGVYDAESHEIALKAWNYLIKQPELTKDNILKTHAILMKGKLDHEELGAWRKESVWIGGHEAKPWYAVPILMDEWIKKANNPMWIKKPGFEVGLDIDQFQDMHIEFEAIHPFIDGNGRMGRILLNWQRIKAGLPILVIQEAEKEAYYEWFK